MSDEPPPKARRKKGQRKAQSSESAPKRPEIPDRVKQMVWGAAAGHCVLCGRTVMVNEDLGTVAPIGELAHIVGGGEGSPRGEDPLPYADRQEPENLLLLCGTCHKPVDEGGYRRAFSVETLLAKKRERETRIREFVEGTIAQPAALLRVVGSIQGVPPGLTYQEAFDATVKAGRFPKLLPTEYRTNVDIDLRQVPAPGTRPYYQSCARQIDAVLERVYAGMRDDKIESLAVFAFARVPVLVYLGSKLDDKIDTLLFQRRRVDGENPWIWPERDADAPTFEVLQRQAGTDRNRVALVVNLSGSAPADEIAETLGPGASIYELLPVQPSHDIIDSRQALANFEATARGWLSAVEREHTAVNSIDLFGAIPLTPAVALGRVRMPNITPAWTVHERDGDLQWQPVLEVGR